jgi:uncharacterized membrane protein YkoI
MKKYVIICGFAGFVLNACAQNVVEGNVPSVVLNSFQKAFPNAVDVEWETTDKAYEVEFDIDRMDHEVWLDQNGKVISHKQELAVNALPKNIAAAVTRDFAGFKTTDADQLEVDGKTTYIVEVKNGGTEWKATYGADGALLQKVPD